MLRLTRLFGLSLTLAAGLLSAAAFSTTAAEFDQPSVEMVSKLREAERYQFNIAEKYYREKNWKVAVTEYEKFLTLYEASVGAPYVQLKWSLCQVQLRKLNTAIKDGFQSIIDYWPESPEAVQAAYLIADTYRDMGEVKKAKSAYATLLTKHPQDAVAVFAKSDLAKIAETEGDNPKRLALLKDITFNAPRKGEGLRNIAVKASQDLGVLSFYAGQFTEGKDALATTYKDQQLPPHVVHFAREPVRHLVSKAETKATGEKLADQIVAFVKSSIPTNPADDAQKEYAKQLWYRVAEIEWDAARHDKVGEVYDQMQKTFGADDGILSATAHYLKARNKRDEARAVFSRFQNNIEGQRQIAWMYREEQKWDQAIAVYNELVKLDKPERASEWQAEIGHTLRGAGKRKEAINQYRVVDRFPWNLRWMAECHMDGKEFKEAITLWSQVMSDEGQAPHALLMIAYCYERDDQKEKAIKTFQQVCEKFPRSGEGSNAHAHLNNVYKITFTRGGAKDE
jgi:TolA-binding protein